MFRLSSGVDGARERSEESVLGTFMFQWESTVKGESVFTRDNLMAMREHERLVLHGPVPYDAVCQLEYTNDGTSSCVPYLSPVSYFFDADGNIVDDVDAVVRGVFATNVSEFGYFLGDFNAETNVVGITRSKYPVGSPFRGFTSATDRFSDQERILGEFLDPIEAALFKRFRMRGNIVTSPYMRPAKEAHVYTRWDSQYMRQRDAARVISSDLAWAIASVASVWAYMVLHTGSAFIATVGMFEILISFPMALLIYKTVYHIQYLGNIQVLSIFVVLGVGADDVFVFYDAYRQSAAVEGVGDDLLERLEYTHTRAARAVFVTSFTTLAAFLATAWSTLIPLAAFGILSATMIACLFVVNVLFFPPSLVIYVRHFERMRWPFSRLMHWMCAREKPSAGGDDKKPKLGHIELFFQGPFYRALALPWVRLPIIAAFAALFIIAARDCSRLETPSELEQWYSRKHLSQQFSDSQVAFMRSDADIVVPIDIFWGVADVDTSGVNRWDLNARGALVLDESFDLSAPEAQQHVYESCVDLHSAACFSTGCKDGKLVSNVDCFMMQFRDYVGANNFPVPQREFASKLHVFRASPTGQPFAQHIGFRNLEGTDELDVFFIKISAKSTLQETSPAAITRSVYSEIDAWVRRRNEIAPASVDNAAQTAYVAWTWMRMQETLIENTFQGISICFVMAFLVLTLATQNILVACICCTCVAGIVVSVLGLGVYRLMGWSLGIRETIAAVILMGLSVDYGVHLGTSYVEAPKKLLTRGERTQYSLTTLGVSITASAITTVISGSILWLCTLQFFFKFAFLITMTIGCSYVWSIGFLAAALLTIGPERGEWNLTVIYNWIKRRVRRTDESET